MKFRLVTDNKTIEAYHEDGPYAKIIRDSLSPEGARLTTMEVRMHRFVLAEFNTHRVFSRNSASSRAIPVKRQISRVKKNTAYPLHWGANKAGMQADEELSPKDIQRCLIEWNALKEQIAHTVEYLAVDKDGPHLHKQVTNRLLEPFMWHTVIVTATEWDNFFSQRCHPAAQPEMKAAADCMQICYYRNDPQSVEQNEWHLPYVTDEDISLVKDYIKSVTGTGRITDEFLNNELRKVSVARCARVSYLTHDGKRDIAEDIKLFDDKLLNYGHWSPFEHVAVPQIRGEHNTFSGNFRGWIQYRKYFQQENRKHFVPNLKEAQRI